MVKLRNKGSGLSLPFVGNKKKPKRKRPGIVDSIIAFLEGVGLLLAGSQGFLISLAIQNQTKDNLTGAWTLFFLGIGFCVLGGVIFLMRTRFLKSKK